MSDIQIRLLQPKPPARLRRSGLQRFVDVAGPVLLVAGPLVTMGLIYLLGELKELMICQIAFGVMILAKMFSLGVGPAVAQMAEAEENRDDAEVLRLAETALGRGDACDGSLGIVRIMQGQTLLRLGRYQEVRASLLAFYRSLAWEASDDKVCALAARGVAQLGDPETALAMLAEITPGGADVVRFRLLGIAEAQEAMGRTAEMEAALEELEALSPSVDECAEAARLRAFAGVRADHARAVARMREALATAPAGHPRHEAWTLDLAWLEALGTPPALPSPSVLKGLENGARKLGPGEHARLHVLLARAHCAAGQVDEAARHLAVARRIPCPAFVQAVVSEFAGTLCGGKLPDDASADVCAVLAAEAYPGELAPAVVVGDVELSLLERLLTSGGVLLTATVGFLGTIVVVARSVPFDPLWIVLPGGFAWLVVFAIRQVEIKRAATRAMNAHDYKRALRLLEAALEREQAPGERMVLAANQVRCLAALGELEAARRMAADAALRLDQVDDLAKLAFAEVYLDIEDRARALALIEQILPRLPGPQRALALALQERATAGRLEA